MAESAMQSYGKNENLNIGLNDTNGRVSPYQYHSQWMARWMQASSISAPLRHKHCALSDASNKKDRIEQEGYRQVENIRMEEGSTSGSRNACNSDLHELGLTLHVHQSAEFVGAEKGRCEMDNSMGQKDVNTCDEVVVSDKLYPHKLPGSSINLESYKTHHFLNPEDVSSEEIHLPMYDINWEMKNVLNPKRRPGHGQVASRFARSHLPVRKTTLSSQVTEFAAKELHFEARRMTESSAQEIEPCESVKGLQPFQGEFIASTSQPAVDRFEAQRRSMKSPVHIKDKRISSISNHELDEHSIRASFTNLKHELCNFTGHSRVVVSEVEGVNEIASSIRSSWSRIKCGSMQVMRDSWPGNILLPSPVTENATAYVHHSLCNMSNCFIHNVGSLGMQNNLNPVKIINRGSQNPSNSLHCRLTARNMCMELSHGEQMIVDSTETAKAKGTALFEMLTVPAASWSHGKQQRDSQPLTKSISMGNGDDVIENETHTAGTRKGSSHKTDTIHIDACQTRSSPKGMNSDRLQKDLVSTNLIKSHSLSASPIKQTVSRYATSSDKSDKEPSTSRTESMNVDQVLSHVQGSNISNSSCIVENSTLAERYNRWLKRLRHKPSDAFGLGTKRMKIGDGPTSAEVCSLLSKVCNYNTSSSDMTKCPKEQQMFDKTKHLPGTLECSYGPSSKELQCWIQRWCHKTPQTAEAQANMATPGLCEPGNQKVLPDNLEGKQFPSIRAMALMGRAMNSFRTGKFQRKGSAVVWNVEYS